MGLEPINRPRLSAGSRLQSMPPHAKASGSLVGGLDFVLARFPAAAILAMLPLI
ncbi:hypothetical protein [Ideonella livida]|uniref:Uncharacterized protein n=1 Tax=Ideonella livida TaxID=2707176 RepID=A0A7C9PEK6_9BURK|nr:hypothetical protein [Ideonella livida]NDY89688.1 hypothetical protein [Ideonella livida]